MVKGHEDFAEGLSAGHDAVPSGELAGENVDEVVVVDILNGVFGVDDERHGIDGNRLLMNGAIVAVEIGNLLFVERAGGDCQTDVIVHVEERVDGGIFVNVDVHDVGAGIVVLEHLHFLLHYIAERSVAGNVGGSFVIVAGLRTATRKERHGAGSHTCNHQIFKKFHIAQSLE